jgi:hypothetical protein
MVNRIYHSPLGNNQWDLQPYKIPTSGICDYLKSPYYQSFYKTLEGHSNVSVKAVTTCPIEKNVYAIWDYYIELSVLTDWFIFMKRGIYRIDIFFVLDDVVLQAWQWFGKIGKHFLTY